MNTFLQNHELKDCCGCRACEQICPRSCIKMFENEEGFLYPRVDESKCIECNMCKRVCPMEEDCKNIGTQTAYAAISLDKESLLKSSSGGVFYLLAKKIVDKGGSVFGAYLDCDYMLKHKEIHTYDAIDDLQGSKYIQSDTNGTYTKVKHLLEQEKQVMYVSTPCQIAGLRLFLNGKTYDNLYTVDLLCHGVPSNRLYTGYIEYLGKKHHGKVNKFFFRDKEKFGWSITQKYVIQKGKTKKAYYIPAGVSPYFYAFLRGKVLRESCYNCPYTSIARVGDITLADFWGVKDILPDLETCYGCSSVLCNTKKGESFFSEIKDNMQLIELTVEEATTGNVNFFEPVKRPKERDVIYKEYMDHGFEYVKRKYLKNPRAMRIYTKKMLKELGILKN